MKAELQTQLVAEAFNLKEIAKYFDRKPLFIDNDECFLDLGKNQYIYVLRYGVLSFFNVEKTQRGSLLAKIQPFALRPLEGQENSVETYTLEFEAGEFDYDNEKLILPIELSEEALRLIMLNHAQSLALDFYAMRSSGLLDTTHKHTTILEQKGKLRLQGRNLTKFIAKTLNYKNKISEHLYVFEVPDVVFEDDSLEALNLQLKTYFDIKERYRGITGQLSIVKENLDLYKDLMFHKESSRLEIIIIVLILIEVAYLFFMKWIS